MRNMLAILILALTAVPLSAQLSHSNKPAPEMGSIRNVYDAFGYGKKGTIQDWGFSALIRYHGKTILFDAGNDADTFAHNVKALGIDLRKVDFAVLSHRHNDHASGFDYLLKVNPSIKIYLPDDRALGAPEEWNWPRRPVELANVPKEQLYFGGDKTLIHYKSSGRFWHANKQFVPASTEIAPGMFLIVTRSVMMGDFSRYPPDEGQPDLTGFPELSLALITTQGVVVVVGCSHSKVEEIVKQTKEQLHKNIELVMGGFHLLNYSKEYDKRLAEMMKNDLGVRRVAPAHCTGNLAFKVFREIYGDNYSYGGLESEVRFAP